MMTRRTFVGTSASIAAGAALGITAAEGIREYGPVDIRTKFLWKDPLVIKASLYSIEKRNIFGVRVFNEGREHARFEMGLGYVRMLAESLPGPALGCFLTVIDETGQRDVHRIRLQTDASRLTIFIEDRERPGDESMPVWIPLRDVQRVL
jgi:hypothetical protein